MFRRWTVSLIRAGSAFQLSKGCQAKQRRAEGDQSEAVSRGTRGGHPREAPVQDVGAKLFFTARQCQRWRVGVLQLGVVADAVLVTIEEWARRAVDEDRVHLGGVSRRVRLEISVEGANHLPRVPRRQAAVPLQIISEDVQRVETALIGEVAGNALRHTKSL